MHTTTTATTTATTTLAITTAIGVLGTPAVAGTPEPYTLLSFDNEIRGVSAAFLPGIEGEIVNTRFDLVFDVYDGYDPANFRFTIVVPLANPDGDFPNEVFLELTGDDLGLTGPGLHTIAFETDVFNGVIATATDDNPFPPFWVFEVYTTDLYPGVLGYMTGTVELDLIPAPASLAALAFGLAGTRRRRASDETGPGRSAS